MNVFNVNVTQQGYKKSQTLFNLSETNLVSRFKRTIKCISNVIYIVNNIVTTRVFVPALVLEQNVLPKFTVTIFIFFSKIPQHLRTYDEKDNIPLSLQLIINQKSKYYSMFNLIKVKPKQKSF